MSEPRFEVSFSPSAQKEYMQLDGSVIGQVNAALDALEKRADEIGTPLRNDQRTKLAGLKEIKLRDIGIRIVFKVTNQVVSVLRVVYILTINKRDMMKVFSIAHDRYTNYRKDPEGALRVARRYKKRKS